MGRIIIGVILIVLQVLAYMGNAKAGGVQFSPSFSLYGIASFLGYNTIGISGVIFLVCGCLSPNKSKKTLLEIYIELAEVVEDLTHDDEENGTNKADLLDDILSDSGFDIADGKVPDIYKVKTSLSRLEAFQGYHGVDLKSPIKKLQKYIEKRGH